MNVLSLFGSNLHLIEWNCVIIDQHHQQYHQLRRNTLRGDSIFNLKISTNIGKKISLINRTENEEYWQNKSGVILMNVCQLLKISKNHTKDYYYEFK